MFGFGRRRIYFDYAGAMPVSERALRAFERSVRLYANPGALHGDGTAAAALLADARAAVAESLACKASEIVFTSGGTEGNNLAILGTANALEKEGRLSGSRFLVSSIEHPSVLETAYSLTARGVQVETIPVLPSGAIDPEAVVSMLDERVAFVSIGWANGEIGTVQPLSRISRAVREWERATQLSERPGIIIHSDLGQGPLYLFPQVHTLGIDLATLDGGKLGSVRGVGVLFRRQGTPISPVSFGGSQEGGVRPGTENMPAAMSLAAVLVENGEEREREAKRLAELREEIIKRLKGSTVLSGLQVNGTAREQLPSIINISIPGIDNEYVALSLDAAGFSIATKSACREGEKESHVVLAVARKDEVWRASTALRISLGKESQGEGCERLIRLLEGIVERTRRYS